MSDPFTIRNREDCVLLLDPLPAFQSVVGSTIADFAALDAISRTGQYRGYSSHQRKPLNPKREQQKAQRLARKITRRHG